MSRKYDLTLLERLKERQVQGEYMGAPFIIKRVPDCDEDGCMDPRLYDDMKKRMKLVQFVPLRMMKINISEKGIRKLRDSFNQVKSISVCTKEIERKVWKVKVSDGNEIELYHYKQEKTTKESPVLFYIHGGGFFGGHHGVVEESLKLMCEKFAFSIFSIDYRLAPENPYPCGHEDCFTGLQWIYDNAETLGINKELIFVAGDSAGGNLAQYCSTRDFEKGNYIVKGQLLLYPTLNMARKEDRYFKWGLHHFKMTKQQAKGLTKMLMIFDDMSEGLRSILKTDVVDHDYLNPYTRNPKHNPPTFITVGEHDYLKVESIAYAAKLHDAGIFVETIVYNGMGHAYFDNTGVYPQCEDCINEMGQFILNLAKV